MRTNTFRMVTVTLLIAVVVSLLPSGMTFAADASVTLTSVLRQGELITNYTTDSSQVSTFDPQRAEDSVSIDQIENLFLGLTNYSALVPGEIEGELATSWDVSEDGLTWTFTLRDDVPWVRHNPTAGETEMLRMVTAQDVEYGFKRACDPRLAGYYSNMARQIVEGCDELNDMPVEEITEESYDLVNVAALDDTTLEVNLQFAAGYFFSQTPMWIYRPVPREIIEEYGDNWTDVGNMVTNGPFILDEYVRGVRRVYLRNPHFPADMFGPGNIERRIVTIVEDQGTRFALYQDHQVDAGPVPAAEVQAVLDDPELDDELFQRSDLAVFYFGFVANKAPFDNVNLRRAFNAVIDRNAFIQEVQQGQGVAMIHFTPPGMFGAVPINEVGVGYNPEYAREQLAEAGYPDCEGFPSVEVVAYSTASTWVEFLSAAAERELGCDPGQFILEQQEFSVLLETTDAANPPEDRPNIYTLGWGPDYADANNWVNEVLYCEGENRPSRPCSEVDDLIIDASRESDPERRIEMYYRIEELLFGPEGVVPIVPLYLRLQYQLKKPWYDWPIETDGLFGGVHWDYRSIDQEAQLAARGG